MIKLVSLDVDGFNAGSDPLGIGCLGINGSLTDNANIGEIKFYDTARTQQEMEDDTQ